MSAATHRVRRQRWAVKAGTESQALAARRWLRDNCDSSLQAALCEAFDRIAPGDAVVRLDRLDVVIRVPNLEKLVEALPATIGEAVSDRLVELQIAAPAKVSAPAGHNNALNRPIDPEDGLFDYLLTGSVRWPDRPDDPALTERLAAVARSAPEVTAAALAVRAQGPRALAEAMFRLLQLIDERAWPAVISAAGAAAMIGLASSPRSNQDNGSAIAERAGESTDRDSRLRLVVSRLDPSSVSRRHSETIDRGDEPIDTMATPEESGTERSPATEKPGIKRARLVQHLIQHGVLTPAEDSRPRPVEVERAETLTPTVQPSSEFGTAVSHAGLVLLHPFLPQFFKTVGIELPKICDPLAQETIRAAALLHHVATGTDEPFEFELGLIKVLLGLTPADPLPVAGGLIGDREREESSALVEALVHHWPALKKTSVDAVRASFLRRPGMIVRDENGWRLHLEPGPFDVLLTRLPWSLSVVKLPWMCTPIHCG